jgi:hypothetical protein
MRRLRAALAFVDRYITLAGRNCCAGRSWAKLDKSLCARDPDNWPK